MNWMNKQSICALAKTFVYKAKARLTSNTTVVSLSGVRHELPAARTNSVGAHIRGVLNFSGFVYK